MLKPTKRFPVYINGRFSNYVGERPESVFWRSLIMFVQSFLKRRKHQLSLTEWIESAPIQPVADGIQWIGHASFLIRMNGISVITDPVCGNLTMLFKRILPAAYSEDVLPQVDVVLISHNHRDHLDESTIKALYKKNPRIHFYVPCGDKKWFVKRGYTNVYECLWWEEFTYKKQDQQIKLTFLPAVHWSQRGVFDRNRSLWGSWMIEGNTTCYFAGDTAFSGHFTEIGHHFSHIDTALMPIAPCEPHKWMKVSHMDAYQAVDAFIALKAQRFVPMHWGAYWFGIDEFTLPIDRLKSYWHNQHILQSKELAILKVGEWLSIEPFVAPSLEVPATLKEPIIYTTISDTSLSGL